MQAGALTPFTIATDRLNVRPFAPTDLGLVEEASLDPEIPMGTTIPVPYTEADGIAFVERQHDRAATGFGWSMVMATAGLVNRADGTAAPTDHPVGQIGLWMANAHHGRAEIGYWIVASARGAGHAAVGVRLVSEWAFEHLDVHRLGLSIEPWNTASIRTAENAGYEREAMLRQWQTVAGEPRDMWSYVLLRAER